MTTRYTLAAAAWVIFATGVAHARCLTEGQDAALSRIADWAEGMDRLGNQALREADEAAGDHVTRFGTVIHRSCLTGARAPLREFTIARLEAAIGYALTQAPRCANTLGLKEFRGFGFKLRRTLLDCRALDPRRGFEIDLMIDHGYQPFRNPFRNFVTSPGWDHTYNVTMNTAIRGGGSPAEHDSIEQLAYHLAHELNHASTANNRAWHDDLAEVESRTVYGCSRSIFLDRVYFTASACFPNSTFGSALYDSASGIFACDDPTAGKNICIRALTETDPAVRSSFARAVGSASLSGFYGPPLTGGDYPRSDAIRVCERLQRTTRLRPPYTQVLQELGATAWLLDALPITLASRAMGFLGRVEGLGNRAQWAGADLPAIRAEIDAERAEFETFVTETCAEPVARDRRPFCENRGARARSILDVREAYADGVAPLDFDLFTIPPVSVPPLPSPRTGQP